MPSLLQTLVELLFLLLKICERAANTILIDDPNHYLPPILITETEDENDILKGYTNNSNKFQNFRITSFPT